MNGNRDQISGKGIHSGRDRRYKGDHICTQGQEQMVHILRNLWAVGMAASKWSAEGHGMPRADVAPAISWRLIELPPIRRATPYRLAHSKKPDHIETDRTEVECALSELQPIEVQQVRGTSMGKIYNGLIEQHHYLGYTRPVGEHLEYVALSGGRVMACMGWCSAPRHIGCRDRHIGWDKQQRKANLSQVIVNTRFLILPWIRVPHLASHLIGLIGRRICGDWRKVYNHDIVWLETFVDPERGFKGTCYRAANWQYLGKTTGRGKADMTHKQNRSIKDVYGYPLRRDFRRVLCDELL